MSPPVSDDLDQVDRHFPVVNLQSPRMAWLKAVLYVAGETDGRLPGGLVTSNRIAAKRARTPNTSLRGFRRRRSLSGGGLRSERLTEVRCWVVTSPSADQRNKLG